MLSLSGFFLQPEFYGWLGTASAHLLDAQILEQLPSAQNWECWTCVHSSAYKIS